jgi:hypothetical protein
MDNPKTLTTWSHKTQDEYQQHHINIRENWRGNQEWTIQRHWQHGHTRHKTDNNKNIQTLEKNKGETQNGTLSNVYLVLFFFVMCLCGTMLSVSLDGPFLISPSVFSNVYMMLLVIVLCLVWPCCQCLWIVHSWLPLQFSLMFKSFL